MSELRQVSRVSFVAMNERLEAALAHDARARTCRSRLKSAAVLGGGDDEVIE
jgi:hypothetical protein